MPQQAGRVLWGDALLIKRFISQCSRTGSSRDQDGYRFEIREFTRWRDRNHPHLHLREINPAFCQDWVSQLREQVEAGLMKPRTFNRRIAAISSLYRWASEPSRSAVTGVPRNPMPHALCSMREDHAPSDESRSDCSWQPSPGRSPRPQRQA